MKKKHILYIGMALLMGSCTDKDDITGGDNGLAVPSADNVIRIGGVNTEGLVARAEVTRAGEDADDGTTGEDAITTIDAEQVSWLVKPLTDGLDITYGDADNRNATSRVAFLKLQKDGDAIKYEVDGDNRYAVYTFKYRDNDDGEVTDDPALWYDNGSHFFEGIYVPAKIAINSTNTVPTDLTTDQHGDATKDPLGNYTLLSHYLAMPPNTTINATVGRIKLPFRHRLARVLAYILIDPTMGSTVTLNGYNHADEDPSTTDIKFCNVQVLSGVKDDYDATKQHHTYTPQWTTQRKIIPHFVGERGSYNDSKNKYVKDAHKEHFIAYYNTQKKYYIYPTDAEWTTVNNKADSYWDSDGKSTDGIYERTIYGKVPVYDLIVRPTYTSTGNVMYDEDNSTESDATIASKKNKIDFELTLNNGLHYTKGFDFDLDANYQTVVYLHISREQVDYNNSGSDLWQETVGYDDWYGVNNQNGNTLSFAGSSWQRAYTFGSTGSGHPDTFTDRVTDGHLYTGDSEDEYAQYVGSDKWLEMFYKAYKGGDHHGDYFILHDDITIDTDKMPDEFTGHLDAQDHVITLTGSKKYMFKGLNGNYLTVQELGTQPDASAAWEANVHKETYGSNTYWVPYRCDTDGWRAEIINAKVKGGTIFKPAVEADPEAGIEAFDPTITGYVHNCWQWSTEGNKYIEHEGYTPTIPQY